MKIKTVKDGIDLSHQIAIKIKILKVKKDLKTQTAKKSEK